MAEPNQVSKIWEAAIRRYEDVTNKKLDGPSVRSLTTVNELRDAIEDQNKVFADFRQKRHSLFAALSAAMRQIELVGAAAGEAGAMVFPPSIFVFAAVQYLIGAAKGVSEKYDAIVEVLEALKDFTVRLETYAHHLMSRGLGGKMAEILAVILEILAISQKEMKRGRLVSFGKSLIGATDEGKEAMQKLGKLFDSEKGIVGAETLSEVKSIAIAVDKLHIDVSTLVNSQSTHATQDQNPLRKIRAILDPSGRPDEINEPNFKAWMGGEKPILWISGNPGAGKSYIATNVITDLFAAYPKRHEDTSTVSIGYFFFKDDNPRTRSFQQGLRDIAYMISQIDQAYEKHILATCDTPDDVSSLYKPPKRKIFIVLDGLDEAFQEERAEFLKLAKDIGQSSQIQLVMFGRLQVMDDIEQYLDMPDVPTIHVTAETNSQDIRRYIRSTISKAVYLKKSSRQLLNEIITQLSKKAQGMFTWVNLIFTDILKMRGEGVIRKALQEAPRGLPKMIRHVLEGCSISLRESPDVLHDFNEILIWVAVTARPLKLAEINSVLKWRSDIGEGMIGLERSLRTQFASFFTLTRQDGLSTADLQKLQHGAETLGTDEDGKLCSQSASEDEDWDEAEDESDSDPLTTEVTFSHASFGDFLHDENEGPVSGGQNTLPVGVDIRNANSPKEPVALELKSNVASVWLELLRKIDITKTSEEDKKAIAHGLMSVLSNSPGLADVNWNAQLTSRNSLDLLKLWLESSPDPEIKELCSLITAENNVDLLSNVIRRIGKRWLATSNGDWLSDARAVAGFMAFRSGEEPKPGLVSNETILKCANWLSLDQDALWHLRLGATLRDFRHYTQALGHFETSGSLASKEEQWPIRHSKSWLYIEMCKYDTEAELDVEMYQELEALHKEQDVKESKKWGIDLHKVCHRLAICYRELKNEDQEIDYLEKATSYDMRCYLCLRKLITLLWFRQNFGSIIGKLTRMDVQLPDEEYTGLTEVLLTGIWTQDEEDFKYIAVAALYSQKLDWLLMAYNTAIQTAKKEHKTVVAVSLELTIAVIYDKGINRHDEGAEIYKRILDIYGDTRIDLMLVRSMVNAKCYLGSYLIWKAIEDDGPLSEAGQEYGRQLEDLVQRKLRLMVDDNVPSYADRELDMDLYEKNLIKSSMAFMGHSVCYLYLGIYYKLVGRVEDAMTQYAEVLRGCLEILDNDDTADDFAAFSVLFQVVASAIGPEEAVDIFYLSWANRAILAQLWAKRTDIITTEHEGSKSTLQTRLAPSNNMSRAESEKDEKKIEESSISSQTLSWTIKEVECLGCWNDFKPGQWESIMYATTACMGSA
ncbi:hypothetical protein VE02_00688 [Pseudogymnoascus sp. 03VT05]|nr:hypothetical protein VE02_00688 [Pseudogymnoascus sp. 03VT05]